MGVACAPHLPLAVYGRSAKASPSVHARECVWHAWESQIVPLSVDEQFPPDTVFVVCEEDFRFCQSDPGLELDLEERARKETLENLCVMGSVDCAGGHAGCEPAAHQLARAVCSRCNGFLEKRPQF